MKTTIATLAALFASASAGAQNVPVAEELWRTNTADRPEAVHVPPGSNWAYIGNQSGEGEETDPPGIGYISRLNLVSGTYEDRWMEGFDGPLGITSSGSEMFLVDNGDRVVAVDIGTGTQTGEWPAPQGERFLNDVGIDPQGRVWVTDTRADELLRLVDGHWEVVFSGGPFDGANGVEYVDGWVYVVCSSGVGNLIRINPETLEYDVLITGEGSLDGVVTDGRGGLVLSDLGGRLLHWSEASGITVLDGFEDEDIMLNSIGGTSDGLLMFAPHWSQSQITAFRLTYPEN
jgi:sugar lactone lactonase YvrE